MQATLPLGTVVFLFRIFGGIPKRPTGADCKSAGVRLRWFESTSLHQILNLRLVSKEVDWNHRIGHRFDKIVWNDFEQPKAGPKGGGQDARSNPPPSTRFWACGLESTV